MDVEAKQEGTMEVEQQGEVEDHGVVEEVHSEVEELEEDFHKVHATIQGLFEKVDRLFVGQDNISARFKYIRISNLAMLPKAMVQSSRKRCIFPAMYRRCGVRAEASIFLCLSCSLPVPKDFPCESCGNPLVCDDYWCKDCATTVGIGEDGVCDRCGRNTSTIAEDDSVFVLDTEVN
jgi:hypothetical protein